MTFKQFGSWCNDRACDGCWGYKEALLCIEVIDNVRKYPFWKREKVWNRYFKERIMTAIVEPTNRKIQEVFGAKMDGGNEDV